jgi:hypothetical protein
MPQRFDQEWHQDIVQLGVRSLGQFLVHLLRATFR